MSIVLRILAALVMLVGVAGLIYMGAKLLHEDELRGAWFIRDFYFELSGLNTAAIALGGMLWALTRLAYRPSAAAASAPSAIPDANTVRRKRDVMGGLLRVIGLMQIGIGFVAFVVFYYAFVTQQKQGQGEPPWGWLFYLTVAALGYVSLGGIVLALTRMADPPRSRP
jgi:hypothetical protein